MERSENWLRQAEKALKDVYNKNNREAKGHSILGLIKGLEDIYKIPPEFYYYARNFSRHYIETRYPNGFPEGAPMDYFDKQMAEEAINASEKIYNCVGILFLDKEKIFKKLKEIAEKIKKEKNKGKEIILFGSFAKNNFFPSSDIDILIILEESEIEFLKRQDEFVDYFSSMGIDVNILVYTEKEVCKLLKEENAFIKNALKGKKL